jgi:putative ABC transport system permease protein
MKFPEMIGLGFANLWRTKLRTSLTLLGVVIGVGALTSMISFGTGMEKNITDMFRENDLFTSIYVTARKIDLGNEGDVATMMEDLEKKPVRLNDSTVNLFLGMEAVEIAYPEISFQVRAKLFSREESLKVAGLPVYMQNYPPFNDIAYGTFFQEDSSATMVISLDALRKLKIIVNDPDEPVELNDAEIRRGMLLLPPDSIIGKSIFLTTAVIDAPALYLRSFDIFGKPGRIPVKKVTIPFIICGIVKNKSPFGVWNFKNDIFMSYRTAGKIPRLPGANFLDLLGDDNNEGTYNSIYIRVTSPKEMDAMISRLKDMNFNILTFSAQLKELRRNFLIMDGVLAAIGTIALIVAGLGIMNTMIMSILERTREIGIMKAIGGSETQIRLIFFVEAGVIGCIGAILGLVLGWVVTIIANKIANLQILPVGEPPVDFFYFPAWLILGAIVFSITLSLAAGLYPAIRASRIDPVKALRHD